MTPLSILAQRANPLRDPVLVGQRVEERATAASKIVATNVALLDSLARQALQRIDETLGDNIAPGGPPKVRNISEAVADLPGQAWNKR